MMSAHIRRLGTAMTLLFVGFCLDGRAVADLTINTPTGLTAGDTFRIAFLTDDPTAANSTSIASYNSFVSQEATLEAGGAATYNGVALTWTAIASTAAVSATSNIGEYGVPVYLASGTLVSPYDNALGLWSGTLSNPLDQDLTGNTFAFQYVWTGTQSNGAGDSGYELGQSHGELGYSGATSSNWIDVDIHYNNFLSGNMYGISQVLTVPATVSAPEPSSLLTAAMWICGGAAITMWRKRSAQRRQTRV
jgi:hypothetical protein